MLARSELNKGIYANRTNPLEGDSPLGTLYDGLDPLETEITAEDEYQVEVMQEEKVLNQPGKWFQ